MAAFGSLTLAFWMLLQVAGFPAPEAVFDPGERARLEREQNVEKRIKIYESASKRIQKLIESAAREDDFSTVPEKLKMWTALLTGSLEDIQTNLKKKKKSRDLIKYEIQLRKSIASTQKLKISAPIDQHDLFDSCISEAEEVRKKIVEILFRH